jgi:cyclopropane fatty-acyl-phospholipid synthase-like methyltransferase
MSDAGQRWDQAYLAPGSAPWDIGRPQSAIVGLADAGEIRSPVLDSGCGTGEHALFLAERGYEVLGVDVAPTAIARARDKAQTRGLSGEFLIHDVLDLGVLGRQFAAVIDSGVFHTFSDEDRPRYVDSLASVTTDGSVLHLLCFSNQVPGEVGPRRVSQAEIREAFDDGWNVERITGSQFDVAQEFQLRPHAWLARIVRRAQTGPQR